MLALGIPGSATAAVLLGGLMIWGLQPGPLLFVEQKDFVWGLIASMYLGNIAGLIIVLTTVPLFAAILRIPFSIIAPIIIVVCAIGAYTVHTAMLDVWFMLLFGVIGYVLKKLELSAGAAGAVAGAGRQAETAFRQSMIGPIGQPRHLLVEPAGRQHHDAGAAHAVLAGPGLCLAPHDRHPGRPPGQGAAAMNANAGTVRLTIAGPVASVVFDRPAARNAMTWTMYQELGAICDRLRNEPSVRVDVAARRRRRGLRGRHRHRAVQGLSDGQAGVDYERSIDEAMARLEGLPIATVAVIEGWVVGGGLAIATACDIRIATASARMGVPIAKTLGNCLSMASIARLVAAFGRPRVQRMLIAAEILTAEEALGCGYLAQVVGADAIDATCASLCQRLATLAPVTQAVSKEGLRRLLLNNLPDAQDLIMRTYGSEDFREGVTAFTEKRPPVWRGR